MPDNKHPPRLAEHGEVSTIGTARLWLAIGADLIATAIVVANALRLLPHNSD